MHKIQTQFPSPFRKFFGKQREGTKYTTEKRRTKISIGGQTEIATAFSGATVGVTSGDVSELGLAGDDVVADSIELGDGGVSCCAVDNATFWIFPGSLASGALMLDQDVRSPNFVRRHLRLLLLINSICRRWDRDRIRLLPLPIGLYLYKLARHRARWTRATLSRAFAQNELLVLYNCEKR